MTLRRKIKKMVYRMGFRPKHGSLFYSPTLHWMYSARTMTKKMGVDF